MPIWFLCYLVLMGGLLAVNASYALARHGRFSLAIYELSAGSYFLAFAALYWLPEHHYLLHWLHLPVFVLLLGVEATLAVYLRPEDLGLELGPDLGEREIELAKALSALSMLPAYLLGTLLCDALLKSCR